MLFEPAGIRIRRLTEAITILKGCFADGPFSFSAEHHTLTGHDGAPKPAQQTGTELTTEEILDSPHVFIGTIKDLTRKFTDLRERFGISSFLFDDLDTLAPVGEQLPGQ